MDSGLVLRKNKTDITLFQREEAHLSALKLERKAETFFIGAEEVETFLKVQRSDLTMYIVTMFYHLVLYCL